MNIIGMVLHPGEGWGCQQIFTQILLLRFYITVQLALLENMALELGCQCVKIALLGAIAQPLAPQSVPCVKQEVSNVMIIHNGHPVTHVLLEATTI